MSAIKSSIKKLLVAKAEKTYKNELKSKNMDYDKWVRQVEKQQILENSGFRMVENCLTIESDFDENEREKIINDEKLAECIKLCKLITVFDASDNEDGMGKYLVCNADLLPLVQKILKSTKITITAVILRLYDGEISKNGIFEIHKRFLNNKNQILIYTDEDVILPNNKRVNPWFKPDWAPDDFLSYYYLGGIVAVRSEELVNITPEKDIYNTLYKLLVFKGAFSRHKSFDAKDDPQYDGCCIVSHIPIVAFNAYPKSSLKQDNRGLSIEDESDLGSCVYNRVLELKIDNPLREKTTDLTISVIIPSKDHPEILFRCIDSLVDKTIIPENSSIEIVIVDNGSTYENKCMIESLVDNYNKKNDYSFVYIYDKRDFNFSYMCNTGANKAKGNYFLFLNDDMEIVDDKWLVKLMEKAVLPYAGAVGAKLIYPPSIRKEGDIIQHAGITNLRIGPAHKLQFMSDSIDHYFGRNRFCHDMMGVTGACLLVKKDIFTQIGGFDEKLAVAFNDVDLCYRIFEQGYYNIERNDTVLYHHESLSRGNDSLDTAKQKRLNREKDYLYEKHTGIYGRDPFYNINLTTDMLETEYAPRYHYEVDLSRKWGKIRDITDVINRSREDKCVRIGMECAMDIYKWKYGVSSSKGVVAPKEDDMGFYFQGYMFVIGSNNACFERQLFLENTSTSQVFGIDTDVEFRPDIAANVPDQLNVDLAGYTARLKAGDIPGGEYRFGMFVKDRTSGLRLYNYSNWTIVI